MALIVPLLVPSGQGRLVAAAGVGVVVIAAAIAFLVRRVPWSLPFLVLAAVPARVPVTVGDESATLLVPLYVIVFGAAAELAWSLWRDEPRSRELGAVSWPVAFFVAWASASAFWADNATEAAIDLFFFILPFALLALAVARLPWRDAAPPWLLRLLIGMALLFAAVGIWQWATRDIFWNQKVVRGNENSILFRVNSLFWGPLDLRQVPRARHPLAPGRCRLRPGPDKASLGRPRTGRPLGGAALLFLPVELRGALAGLAVLVIVGWRARGAQALTLLVVVAAAVALLAPGLESVRSKLTDPSSQSVNRVTRGRSDLVTRGFRIAADHPVIGVGVGNFTSAYEERFDAPGRLRTPASHTTPVTVLVETGVVGLLLFGWLTVAAPPSPSARGGPPTSPFASRRW